MKKKIFCMLLVTMMIGSMVSCSNGNDKKDDQSTGSEVSQSVENDSNKDIDMEDLAQKLLKDVAFKDEMGAIDEDVALMQYNLTENEVDDIVMYLSTGASAEEIAIFEVKGDNLKAVQSAVEKRVEEKRTSFKDYNPNEMEKLKDPTMYSKGKYVVLCISDEDAKSRETIDKYMSAK